MPRARRTFERPPAEHVAAAGRLATTLLSDAMGRAGSMDARIQSISVSKLVAGPAVTVRIHPNDNLMCLVAVSLVQPGDIMVIDAGGDLGAGIWGEILTRAALARGCAGVVIDGAARDREEITALGFPVWAAGVIPRGTIKKFPGDANVPVSCGGLTVEPGDIIVGDADGVVVVPRARAGEITAKAAEAAQREQQWREAIAGGALLHEMPMIASILAESDLIWE